MRDDNLDYTAIRRRVEIELQQERRRGQTILFAINVFLLCFFMLLTWVIIPNTSVTITSSDYFGTMTAIYNAWAAKVLLSVGWTIGLLLHGLAAYANSSNGWIDRYRRRLLAREIEFARLGIDEDRLNESAPVGKAKRGPLELSEDGEMIEVQENEPEANRSHHA
ncbi:MAG: hypothetical protein HZC41_23640 [Chloroflexi bacterium]|nr:hypothetical protein [Chloroflexota bacterium]